MKNELISPLSGLRRLIESNQIDAPDDFLKDKAPIWSPHNKIINVTPGPAWGSELVDQFSSTQTRGMRGPNVAKFFTDVRGEYAKMVGMQEGGRALFFTGSGTTGTEAVAGSCRFPGEAAGLSDARSRHRCNAAAPSAGCQGCCAPTRAAGDPRPQQCSVARSLAARALLPRPAAAGAGG